MYCPTPRRASNNSTLTSPKAKNNEYTFSSPANIPFSSSPPSEWNLRLIKRIKQY